MIIVGLQPGELSTIYRMRALLANMTTMSRLSPFFQERTVAEDATFFDLLKLLGFTRAHHHRRREGHASGDDQVGAAFAGAAGGSASVSAGASSSRSNLDDMIGARTRAVRAPSPARS